MAVVTVIILGVLGYVATSIWHVLSYTALAVTGGAIAFSGLVWFYYQMLP